MLKNCNLISEKLLLKVTYFVIPQQVDIESESSGKMTFKPINHTRKDLFSKIAVFSSYLALFTYILSHNYNMNDIYISQRDDQLRRLIVVSVY